MKEHEIIKETLASPSESSQELASPRGSAAAIISQAEQDLNRRIDQWLQTWKDRTYAELIGVLETTKSRLLMELHDHFNESN